jgi:hypothetical protein
MTTQHAENVKEGGKARDGLVRARTSWPIVDASIVDGGKVGENATYPWP